jgi:hypothetical protein
MKHAVVQTSFTSLGLVVAKSSTCELASDVGGKPVFRPLPKADRAESLKESYERGCQEEIPLHCSPGKTVPAGSLGLIEVARRGGPTNLWARRFIV